jgi:hypothetical protein
MTTLAHTGHWALSLLYVLPAVLIAGGLWWAGRRDASASTRGDRESGEQEQAP